MRARATLIAALLLSSAAVAGKPDCGVDEHESGGHCCRAGEDWVPAKRKCVCLDPQTCGGASAGPSKAEQTLAKVGEAFVAALEFESMVSKMRGLDNDYARAVFARELGAAKRRFTCDQIARLMATAQTDIVSSDIAGSLYPYAADPDNFATLLTGLKTPGLSQAYLKKKCGKA